MTVRAAAGMVCAVDRLAAEAGVDALRRGGTAADAAVATSAVLAVTTQHMCGMGGDLWAIAAAAGEDPLVLNGSGRAGSGADPARLRSEGCSRMPFRGDVRSVTIPGCVDGWIELHARFGRLPWPDVLAPARSYAEGGFPASPTLAASVPLVAHVAAARDFLAGGELRPRAVVRRPGVGRALAALARDGRAGFYGGEFGNGLVALGAGEFHPSDLARRQAEWVPAIAAPAWGHRIWTAPPASQGYLLASAAWMASRLDLPTDPGDAGDPAWAHLLIEASRQAGFDRRQALHDGADGAALLSPERLEPRLAAIAADRAARLEGAYAGGGTIALCAVDRDRLGVCVLQSNAAGFGSYLAEPTTGIFLQNRGIGFNLRPGDPAEYGPGRRPPHTLCPTAVTRPDGALAGVLGTMGGDSQPQILLQVLARWLASGEEPGGAIEAPRFVLTTAGEGTMFDTWSLGGRVTVLLEAGAPPAWGPGLQARGHQVVQLGPGETHTFGHAHLIAVRPDGGLAGGTDPRPGAGAAVGL